MKKTDVPTGAHQTQKLHQCTRALGEHKAQQPLVMGQAAVAAHHVADVLFGQLVVCQVQCLKAMLAKVVSNLG